MKLSIIIPLAPNETDWQDLLIKLPVNAEILLVHSSSCNPPKIELKSMRRQVRVIAAKSGRASQMNAGSDLASGDYLWFLHADSRFDDDTISALLEAIKNHENSLLFFDFAFIREKLSLMAINEIGAKFRSNILNTPFGDQGFCIKKTLFFKVGKFCENAKYGEDHLFVKKARKCGIKIKAVGAKLFTSARKYKKYGWLRITLLHQFLWIKQIITNR